MWQELTGIRHGLFPEEDPKLPPGWTREDAHDIQSWFLLYRDTNDDKSGATMPGKAKWVKFIRGKWEAWKLHSAIVKALRENNVHPIQIATNENSMDMWPAADNYVASAVEDVGLSIFGKEALGPMGFFPHHVRKCILVFIQRSWARVRTQVQRDGKRLASLEADAIAAFSGECVHAAALLLLLFFFLLSTHQPWTKER